MIAYSVPKSLTYISFLLNPKSIPAPEVSAQLLCATPTAHWLEYADWWNAVVKEPLCVEKGMACIDGVIGSVVEWNEEALPRYRLWGGLLICGRLAIGQAREARHKAAV